MSPVFRGRKGKKAKKKGPRPEAPLQGFWFADLADSAAARMREQSSEALLRLLA